MNRFLKKVWEDTEIPRESYLRARNRAWMELQGRARRRIPSLRYVVVTMVIVLLVFVVSTVRETEQVDRDTTPVTVAKQPLHAGAPEPTTPSDDPTRVKVEAQREPIVGTTSVIAQMPERDKPLKPHTDQSESSTQLVLNFRLPTTGVRMIWIMEKKTSMARGGL